MLARSAFTEMYFWSALSAHLQHVFHVLLRMLV